MSGQEAYRHMPYDIEVEQSLLGTLLRDQTAFYRLEDRLEAEDFFDPLHQRIFEMIGDRLKRRMSVTPLTLHASMKADPGLMEVGGHAYFAGLMQAAPALPNLKTLAGIIHDLAARRRLIQIGEDLVNAAYAGPSPDDDPAQTGAEAIGNKAAEELYELVRKTEIGRGAVGIRQLMGEAVEKANDAMLRPAEVCLTSGLKTVDQELGGIYRSDLLVLAGAPNMGKSAAAAGIGMANALGLRYGETRADLAAEVDREPVTALFFSLEMADWQLGMREIAERTNIPSNLMRRGKLQPIDIDVMRANHAEAKDIPLFVDGGRKLSVAQIRARAHARMRYSHGKLGLIIIDHLRFVRPANWKLDEKDQIQQITGDLKDLAVELNCAVVLLAHLNREYSKRASKRPVNSDLYGASAIEQNADAIWFLHSEHYFLEREEPPASDAKARAEWLRRSEEEKGWMEIFSTKARMDKVGKARVRFEPAFTRFSDPEWTRPTTAPSAPDLLTRVSDPLDGLDEPPPNLGDNR